MLDGDIIQPTESKSGRIWHMLPSTYVAWVNNYVAADTQQDTGVPFWTRAYFSFDTSSVPDYAEITYAAFRFRRRSDPTGDPEDYLLKISIGTFIGAALDGNAAEWTAGTLDGSLDAKPADKDLLIFTATGRALVNKTGDTDVKLWDDSTQGTGDPTWQTNFNKDVSNWCKLELEWSIPSGTATGVGTASCTLELIGEMTATATGVGTASCTLELVGEMTGTATGVGTASCTLELVGEMTGTATGVGTASCTLELVGEMTGTATGVGTASCDLVRDVLLIMTATGIGTATLGAGIDPGELAIHSATRSLAAVDSGTLAVAAVDSRTLAFEDGHSSTRDGRRIDS